MSGHTPGPWEADGATTPGGLGRRYHEIFGPQPDGISIAHTADRDRAVGAGEDAANALLLAAAPELAEALEACRTACQAASVTADYEGKPEFIRSKCLAAAELARVALAKAGRLP